uniref:Uncharacterized protein n=1 Tax=Denticeps clupeoides TaxID=299321 RepID=A0AAY4D588_9TELE
LKAIHPKTCLDIPSTVHICCVPVEDPFPEGRTKRERVRLVSVFFFTQNSLHLLNYTKNFDN